MSGTGPHSFDLSEELDPWSEIRPGAARTRPVSLVRVVVLSNVEHGAARCADEESAGTPRLGRQRVDDLVAEALRAMA
jgi:hypothetical protein